MARNNDYTAKSVELLHPHATARKRTVAPADRNSNR